MIRWWKVWWMMQAQKSIIKSIGLAMRAEHEARDYANMDTHEGPQFRRYFGRIWVEEAEKWRAKRREHQKRFFELQADIDACLGQ